MRLRKRRIGRGRRQRRRHRLDGQRAFVDQAVDHAGADAGFPRGVRFAVQQAVGQNSISRRRAGVIRRGGSPTSRTPTRIRSGPRFSPIRKVMRNTMPRADSV